ncbi:MAG TPA: type IV pilus secretin PilQ [Blastocatellia bacterium]|nr:type IV pilus secretin PilQ [Blastocatellia bacterium]
MTISSSLCLSLLFSAAALAQTQVAADATAKAAAKTGAMAKTAGSVDEKKGGVKDSPTNKVSTLPAAVSSARPDESKTGASRAAAAVRMINVKKEGADVVAAIELDGQPSFDHFTLTGPNRLVVDVRNASNLAAPLLRVGQSGIERVRTGNFQGNVRVVFDTASPQNYQISREGNRIIVRFAGKPESPVHPLQKDTVVKFPAGSVTPAPSSVPPLAAPAKTATAKADSKTAPAKTEPVKAAAGQVNGKTDTESKAPDTTAKATEKPAVTATSRTQPQAPAKEMKVLGFEAKSEKSPAEKKPLQESAKASAKENANASATTGATAKSSAPVTARQPEAKAQVKPETVAVSDSKPAVIPEPKASAKPESSVETKAAVKQTSVDTPAVPRKVESTSPAPVESRPRVSEQQPRLATAPVPTATPKPTPVSEPPQKPRAAAQPTGVFDASEYTKAGFSGEPIKLDLKAVDLREVLRFISETYKVNFVVDKSVSDSVPVTVSVEEVPWNKALDALLRSNRLGIQVEGNILRVMSQSAIAEEDDQRRKQTDARQQAAPLVTKLIKLNYAKAAGGGAAGGGSPSPSGGAGGNASGLDAVIKSRLSPRGVIQPDPRTNTLVVTDIPENIAIIEEMISKLDVPEAQVEIEARIVIANRNFARDLGVQLAGVATNPSRGGLVGFTTLPSGGSGSGGGTSGLNPNGIPGGIVGSPQPSGTLGNVGNSILSLTTGIFGTAQISAVLSAQESKGNIKTVSTPRITAQNNQVANIVNGVQIPVQTESNNTVTVTFVTAALKLEITPQITEAGTVVLHVIAENNSVNLAIATRAAPGINTQRAETTVLVPDGGTTIIGGINIDTESQSQQRTPGVSRIPGLGELFKRRTVSRQNDEILFFITPRIYRALELPSANPAGNKTAPASGGGMSK